MKMEDISPRYRTSEYVSDLIMMDRIHYRHCLGEHQFRTVEFIQSDMVSSDHVEAIYSLDCVTVIFEEPRWFGFRVKIALYRGRHRLPLDEIDRRFLLKAYRMWRYKSSIDKDEVDLEKLRFWP